MDLSMELIRLVASYTSYESVTTLSCVSIRLRIACQDWTVFKGVLRHTHIEAFRYVLQTQRANVLMWKQLARAGSRAVAAEVHTPDFLLWGPQLLALQRE
jgi:hypothetical protein